MGHPGTPTDFPPGPWEAPIPPSVGAEVKGHPYTPTKFLLGPRGQPQYFLELILGSRGTRVAGAPYTQSPYTHPVQTPRTPH